MTEPAQAVAPSDDAGSVASIEIIIPVKDRLDNVRACLKALDQTDYPRRALRVTVVDDAATAASFAASLARLATDGALYDRLAAGAVAPRAFDLAAFVQELRTLALGKPDGRQIRRTERS